MTISDFETEWNLTISGSAFITCLISEIMSSYPIAALRPKLAKHKEFAELSKKFVMVNTEDNDEPKGEQFDVDGKYVPRIFFLGKRTTN